MVYINIFLIVSLINASEKHKFQFEIFMKLFIKIYYFNVTMLINSNNKQLLPISKHKKLVHGYCKVI